MKQLLNDTWQIIKFMLKTLWDIITLIPNAIGIPDWGVIVIIVIAIIIILLIRKR